MSKILYLVFKYEKPEDMAHLKYTSALTVVLVLLSFLDIYFSYSDFSDLLYHIQNRLFQ